MCHSAQNTRNWEGSILYKAYDSDSHVWEGEHTFSDKYWDPAYANRRPMVVESDSQGNLSFIIDSLSFPRVSGPFIAIGGNPTSKDGIPSPSMRRHLEQQPGKWNVETLESAEFRNAAARIEQMDREYVDVEVNYPSMLLTWPLAYDNDLGNVLCRSYNSWMADVSGQAPDRLKWVTVINPGDPKAAAKEIERTKELGSAGVMLLGMVGNQHIDHPSMEPIWATAAETDLPVAVHIGFCCPGIDSLYGTITDVITMPFVFSLLLGFQRVFASGLLDRYPKMKVGFLENGARWVDFLAKRIGEQSGRIPERTTAAAATGRQAPPSLPPGGIAGTSLFRPGAYKSQGLPEDYIRDGRVFVNAEVDENQVPFLVEEYGNNFLLFASDIPHGHRLVDPVNTLMQRTDLSDETKRKWLRDNTANFYGLPLREPAEEEKEPAAAGA